MSINGFTDSIGLADYNIRLSEERAEAVFKRLINYGVDAKRMKFKGYGELKPKYFNDLEKNMILNRRTELEVIGY
jgi:outer membrane protein OmpA-like peptidoglycan-associated protein